jgi:hypothetical protein
VACGTLSNATAYSFSWFIKAPTNSLTSVWLYVSDGGDGTGGNRWGVIVDLSNFTLTDYTAGNGSVTSKAVENYGNGWYRIRVTGQVTSGMVGSSVAVVRKLTAGADTNGINGVLVWGAQVETGSVATSYIPTTAAAVTRNEEVISVTGAVSGCIGQTQGTIYAEVDMRNLGVGVSIINIQTSSYLSGAVRIDTTALNQLRIQIRDASGNNRLDATIVSPSPTLSAGINKIAVGYSSDASGVVIALNGSVIATTTVSASFGTLGANRVYLGTRQISGFNDLFINNRIRAAALYTTRLTNAQLAALTTL